MAGYQFIHVEAYARSGSVQTKKDGTKIKKWSTRDIIAEARREQQATHHINEPQPLDAGLVYGVALLEVEKISTEWADQAKDAKGRKLRKDGHCLLAGVISLPASEKQHWEQFKKKSVEWLKDKYGDRLKSVVEHTDERHPHLHYYCVPHHGETFDVLHEGQRAAKQAAAEGKVKGEQNRAYINAMRAFQDVFSHAVGQLYGLARIGPGRRRLTRAQWKAEQKQAEVLAETKRRAKKVYERVKSQAIADSKTVNFLDKLKSGWHKPSNDVKKENEELKKENEELLKANQKLEEKSRSAIARALDEIRKAEKLKQEIAENKNSIKSISEELKDKNKKLSEIYQAGVVKKHQNDKLKFDC